MIFRRAMLTLAAVLLIPPVIHSQPPQGIRGFTVASADGERTLERQFRAIPSPEQLREYMQTITAEPHHAGSPGSRKVADYVLGKFKSWGLDASIEEFEALMPYPDRARRRAGRAGALRRAAEGTAGRGGPGFRPTRGSFRRSTPIRPTATSPPISST